MIQVDLVPIQAASVYEKVAKIVDREGLERVCRDYFFSLGRHNGKSMLMQHFAHEAIEKLLESHRVTARPKTGSVYAEVASRMLQQAEVSIAASASFYTYELYGVAYQDARLNDGTVIDFKTTKRR